jgi:16S rRNA (uracil1498-N3)-methyltransferase
MHRVHAPMAAPPLATLSDAEAHHVTRVLRLGVGASVVVFDGRGREWSGRIASIAGKGVAVDLIEARVPVAEPAVNVTLAIGLLKGDGVDAAVRDATMMGAAALVPFVSAHVAVSGRAQRARSLGRWERIAVAAAKQSHRAVVPECRPVARLEDLLGETTVDLKLACVEPAHGHAEPVTDLPRPKQALVLIGPEGGWAESELNLARSAGARFIDLGPRTLRAETVPLAVLSALWTHWGYT